MAQTALPVHGAARCFSEEEEEMHFVSFASGEQKYVMSLGKQK